MSSGNAHADTLADAKKLNDKISFTGAPNEDPRLRTIAANLGVNSQDVFGVYRNVEAHNALNSILKEYARSMKDKVDVVVGLDSCGFLMGPTMALEMNKPFAAIRKSGKLPFECIGTNCIAEIEIQEWVKEGDRVLVVDDLLATGETLGAAVDLLEDSAMAVVVQCWVLVELSNHEGVENVGAPVHSVIKDDKEYSDEDVLDY